MKKLLEKNEMLKKYKELQQQDRNLYAKKENEPHSQKK